MIKLSGIVKVREEPARSAVVELHNSAGDIVDQVRVGDDGGYTYYLAPGSWALRVWDAHGYRGRAELTLSDGETRVLDVDLEKPEVAEP